MEHKEFLRALLTTLHLDWIFILDWIFRFHLIGFLFGPTQHIYFRRSPSVFLQRTCQFCFHAFVQLSPSSERPFLASLWIMKAYSFSQAWLSSGRLSASVSPPAPRASNYMTSGWLYQSINWDPDTLQDRQNFPRDTQLRIALMKSISRSLVSMCSPA